MLRISRSLLPLLLLACIPACDGIFRYAPVDIIGVEMTSTAIVLAPGDTATVRAFAVYGDYRDPFERPYPPLREHWTSSDPSVVDIHEGHIRALGSGTAVITAEHRTLRDTASVVVRKQESDESRVQAVSVGNSHSCQITESGEVACWGSNTFDMIGVGDPRVVVNYLAPVRLPGARATAISAGSQISCYLDPVGVAHCWGKEAGSDVPEPVASPSPFTSLSSGWFTACGLTPEGDVYCWGREIGDAATRVPLDIPIVEIDGECGRSEEGEVRCWGSFVGLAPEGEAPPFARIAVGFGRGCGLDGEGRAYCWGGNTDGGLGTGPATDTCRGKGGPASPCTPEPAPVLTDLRFSALAMGNGVICGIATAGTPYCWGAWNMSGALGTGDFEPSTTPAPVAVDEPFRSLSAHESMVCGVGESGTAYCWGNAFTGDGRTWTQPPSSTTGTPAPVRVRRPVG